jgi:asparagine synthase (glutamine-hydrolysing)
VRDGETRRLEKLIAQRMLPPDLDVNRKQGFSIPLDAWLRADDCALVREHLDALPPEIDRRETDALIDGERRGRANGGRLYALLMLAFAARNLAAA